ncbi:enterobactin synthetase [Streptomyces longwoodensis]|uniref:enterobactin synthetase n=1 Tax=Streptomyces longwoodensis TaxID=68231 RepID=UPI001FDF21B6|nr:enterobactin synthetase [Streptomyces longwoodensis]
MGGAGRVGGSGEADREARTAADEVTAAAPAALAALERLRPRLAAAGIGLGLAHVGEPGLAPAGPAEASAAATMPPRRRREFLAGREAARRALRAVGVDCGEIPREGRLPVFAPGRAASLSHSAGIAVAVARAPGGHAPLGCDLELRPLPCDAARLVLGPDEEPLLGTAAGAGTWSLTGLFSAKETAWKALHLAQGRAGTASMRTLRDLRAEPCGDALHIGPRIDPRVGRSSRPGLRASSRPRSGPSGLPCTGARAGQSYGVRVRVLPVGAGVFSYALGWAGADGRSTPVPTARRS